MSFDKFIDQESDLESRVEAFNDLSQDDVLEITMRLCGIYKFSGSRDVEKLMCRMCRVGKIHTTIKYEFAKALLEYKEVCMISGESNKRIVDGKNDRRVAVANNILDDILYVADEGDLSHVYKMEMIYCLMESGHHRSNAQTYFNDVISDKTIDGTHRYRYILSLENRGFSGFVQSALGMFISDATGNDPHVRIVGCQYALSREFLLGTPCRAKAQDTLVSIATDETLDVNSRADAADTLINNPVDPECKLLGENVILELSKIGITRGAGMGVFGNAQNVHVSSIEKSCERSLLSLVESNRNEDLIPLEEIQPKILDFFYDSHHHRKERCVECIGRPSRILSEGSCESAMETRRLLDLSIVRISIDRSKFLNEFTLEHILSNIWCEIAKSRECGDELKTRLVEELVEMANTCSSGILSRLLNVLCGFDLHAHIEISFQEQIVANIFGRFSAKIRDIDDVFMENNKIKGDAGDFRDNIASELMCESYRDCGNVLKFFRCVVSKIREEMYTEFRDYVTDSEFDTYFKNGIVKYTG